MNCFCMICLSPASGERIEIDELLNLYSSPFLTTAYTHSATRSPSIAALTIPPEYPAPSPQGYKPRICGCCSVSGSRGIRTGDEVRDSVANMMASLVQ